MGQPLNTAKDALEQRSYYAAVSQEQSGITLLSQAISRLDMVIRSPDKNGCCDASLRQIFFGCLQDPPAGAGSVPRLMWLPTLTADPELRRLRGSPSLVDPRTRATTVF